MYRINGSAPFFQSTRWQRGSSKKKKKRSLKRTLARKNDRLWSDGQPSTGPKINFYFELSILRSPRVRVFLVHADYNVMMSTSIRFISITINAEVTVNSVVVVGIRPRFSISISFNLEYNRHNFSLWPKKYSGLLPCVTRRRVRKKVLYAVFFSTIFRNSSNGGKKKKKRYYIAGPRGPLTYRLIYGSERSEGLNKGIP